MTHTGESLLKVLFFCQFCCLEIKLLYMRMSHCHQMAGNFFSVNYVILCKSEHPFDASPNQATGGQNLRRPAALGPLLCPTLFCYLLKTGVGECPCIPAVHSLQAQLPFQKVYIA